VGRGVHVPIHCFMKLRRTLALLGPLTAAAALLAPWYDYGTETVRGWDTLTGMNWIVLAIAAVVAVPVLLRTDSIARGVSVAGGIGLAAVGLGSLLVRWDATVLGDAGYDTVGRGPGPWIAFAAGIATIAAGRALHPRAGDVATARRLAAVAAPLSAIAALSLPWVLFVEPQMRWIASGWDNEALTDNLLVGFGAAAAAAAVAARRAHARVACVICGLALAAVAARTLIVGFDDPWVEAVTLSGPFVALGCGLAMAVAGVFLYAPRRSASSLITAS
jgi:hypothetical protein